MERSEWFYSLLLEYTSDETVWDLWECFSALVGHSTEHFVHRQFETNIATRLEIIEEMSAYLKKWEKEEKQLGLRLKGYLLNLQSFEERKDPWMGKQCSIFTRNLLRFREIDEGIARVLAKQSGHFMCVLFPWNVLYGFTRCFGMYCTVHSALSEEGNEEAKKDGIFYKDEENILFRLFVDGLKTLRYHRSKCHGNMWDFLSIPCIVATFPNGRPTWRA